jgi:hypothetical protein
VQFLFVLLRAGLYQRDDVEFCKRGDELAEVKRGDVVGWFDVSLFGM